MGYLIISFCLIGFALVGFMQDRQQVRQAVYERVSTSTQRAIEAVQYINAINDYLYGDPTLRTQGGEGELTPTQVGMQARFGIRHVVAGGRVYVWLPSEPGLMTALKRQTVSSALLGTVEQRRLHDSSGLDMGVNVPARIPEGAVVYLN
ncbi:type IV pilus biogenesis protein PilM [Pseudomonas protegens]|nr:type IV pilus biogenesis protein PilM [Pseudomonas protegens]